MGETVTELSFEVASLLRCDSLEVAPALLGAVIAVERLARARRDPP